MPLCSAPVGSPWESSVQLWSPQHRTDMELLEQGQRRPQKGWLENLCCEERLRELGLSSLEKRRLQGDPRAACQYLKGPARELERVF